VVGFPGRRCGSRKTATSGSWRRRQPGSTPRQRQRVVPQSRILTAAEARAYLKSLPDLWAKTSAAGRHAIAEALSERIDVLGVNDFTFALTARARARGRDAASGAGVVSVKEGQLGRGERGSTSLTHLSVRPRFVLENVTGPPKVWPDECRKAG
jgi:hypothetical protein